jgi:dethiobiotin synthetase
MVPLQDQHTVLDLMAALRVPAILVTGTYLGTLSHTLTAIDVLCAREIPLAAVVVNESRDGQGAGEIAAELRRFCPAQFALLERNAGDKSFARLAALLL